MTTTENDYGPECPYCGFVFTPDDAIYYDRYKYTEETCPECGKQFKVKVDHTTIWICDTIDQPAGDPSKEETP